MAKIRKNASSSTRQVNKLAEKQHLCECPKPNSVYLLVCACARANIYTRGGIQMRVFGKQNSRARPTRHILTALEMQLKIQQVGRVRSAKYSPHASSWVYV